MTKSIKRVRDVTLVARTHTETAIRTLTGIASSTKCPPAARVAAAVALLDRGWGKPRQAVDIGAQDGLFAALALPPADWAAAVDRRIEAARQEDVRILLDATQGVPQEAEIVDESGYNGA